MKPNVRLNYSNFPNCIESGIVKISDEQEIKLKISNECSNQIIIEVKDDSFGAEYLNSFVLDYETAKDFYSILYQLLKQIKNKI